MEKKEEIVWTLKKFKIKDLKDNPKNPRFITKEKSSHLKSMLEDFGLIDNPICSEDGVLIGGHQRKNILKQMGKKEVECKIPSRPLSEQETDRLMIGLNLHVGSMDYEILANNWEVPELIKYGFTQEELLGNCKEFQEVESEASPKKPKQKSMCPKCGHEF